MKIILTIQSMHGSRRSGVGSGVQTTSSVENSNLINSHNKSLKTGFGLPHLKKLNYPSPPPPKKKIWIRACKARCRRDYWNSSLFLLKGVEQVAFGRIGKTTSTILVSEGAECILINRKFFQQYLTDEVAKRIRRTVSYQFAHRCTTMIFNTASICSYQSSVKQHLLYHYNN